MPRSNAHETTSEKEDPSRRYRFPFVFLKPSLGTIGQKNEGRAIGPPLVNCRAWPIYSGQTIRKGQLTVFPVAFATGRCIIRTTTLAAVLTRVADGPRFRADDFEPAAVA